ncbi:glutamate synthase large subunit [Sandaracinus amylolyticus]|uniref:Glutamate synthase [NADPH] large chain n=1 Tax=Sandaracinus amylolyticus TaxID=927083 RepID=A0A0F6SGM6_9BACT|nr:glutamate synthase large subunit [Sandaracinus amylolyticus]AKF08959.1 Glutamate synthase [NADPH] large chain [Sandaracinus amylolyticus]
MNESRDHQDEGVEPASPEVRRLAAAEGLYRPEKESDACGVGFVATLRGDRTHAIVTNALTVLENLEHRGAAASDPLTGDGAGILIQIPHELLAQECAKLDIPLGAPGTYGLGMLFLPRDEALRAEVIALIERIVEGEEQVVLGWREVPVQTDKAGPAAQKTMPHVAQILIGPGTLPSDDAALDRKLYVIRKRVESESRRLGLREEEYPYFASLSTRTVVYKGLLTPEQLPRYYVDLADARTTTALALVHQRFSTNTFPSWSRAHPYRRIAHNGEINTLRGNVNWMKAREPVLQAPVFGEDVQKLLPIIDENGSDSAMFDDVLELLVHTGRSLPHAMMMMIPEAWQQHTSMDPVRRAFYEYHSCVMEPWDGPACIAFTDGRFIGATLDRNGLRPARYVVTKDGMIVMASEVGVLDVEPENVAAKNRLQPGRMLLVDTKEGRIVDDAEIKSQVASRRPYGRWVGDHMIRLGELAEQRGSVPPPVDALTRRRLQQAWGYTEEELRIVLAPMAALGEEAIGSMGNDTPPAVLSDRPQLLFSYFRQLFAQVTNPPIDPIREQLVMSLVQCLGPESNLFVESPQHSRKLQIESPILSEEDLEKIRALDQPGLLAHTIGTLFDPKQGIERALLEMCHEAEEAVRQGSTLLILSDRGATKDRAPVPSLLALCAISRHLIAQGLRQRCGLIVESGEPREVMHVCLLIGYGAGAVCPWMAYDSIAAMHAEGLLGAPSASEQLPLHKVLAKYRKSIEKGLLKVMSKMGISTIQSYRGAQIFEALGLSKALIERFFPGTPTHVEGIDIADIERETLARHAAAWAKPKLDVLESELDPGGSYQFRRGGERHAWNPGTIAMLQHAVRGGYYDKFKAWTKRVDDETRAEGAIRGLLDFVPAEPISIDEVEPAHEIVKRFKTGAMSFGSISKEAHETLAIAMNRIGAKSNTGEGGEDPERWTPDENGDLRRSSIKQVASGRFGVTIEYLTNADELQIKIAQGAKPGEGGQLPGHKVDAHIAKTRHSTEGVGLISPPPHHDIYSIEDLAQLVYDLKNANPGARVSVKLVSEAGVGTVAAGVAKAKADLILISGDSGGTGASPLTSIKHAGLAWEIGLAETQQVLVLNGLRGRVRVETDGQMKTGRDVVIAALLGAEEVGFGTISLITMGCVMMRVCHLNTCPVGVATQDPRLRARFSGQPEHVINFFSFVAEEVRELMAQLGFRTFDEMIGRVDRLRQREDVKHGKAQKLDLSRLLWAPPIAGPRRRVAEQDHELELAMDTVLLEQARPALERGDAVEIRMPIRNVHRTACTMLSHEVAKRYGVEGMPDGTIRIHFTGSAGQSFGAFLARGIDVTLEGDANDGCGKGLSGGRIVVHPPEGAGFVPEENIAIGNVALYGATSGELFVRGMAGERFAVRNSGATAVVEGCGDHGCEYMTGGLVVVLGPTGRNFAAGMSGGIAYVLDADGLFETRVNKGMVELETLDAEDLQRIRSLVHRHYQRTMSAHAWKVLSGWKQWSRRFVKVMPVEYRKVLDAKRGASVRIA